ncbi:MAG: Uma2 family endonuclease [Polyangiaceae bacterium]
MPAAARRTGAASRDELLAIPEERRFHEVLGGELLRKALPSGAHGRAQRKLGGKVGDAYDRPPGGGFPGGWWIATEVEVELAAHEIVRPDLVGWRRERMPVLPIEVPIAVRPDWICEVLSRSNASNDTVRKMRVYHRAGVPHYWIVDPEEETVSVYRWTEEGYLLALAAARGDRVRAEPFADVELSLAGLFGDEGGSGG